jgi:ELWxxDGT repeat protein
VADVNDAFRGSSSAGLYGFIEFDGALYFTAFDWDHGYELRKYDGTTVSVIDINPGPAGSHAGAFGGFIEFNGDLYFTAEDPDHGYELRRLDGETGAIDTFDLLPGAGSSEARPLGIVGGSLAIGAWIDESGDGIADRYAMLATTGRPASIDDFYLVDDGSGTFEPGNLQYVADGDLLF